MAKRGPVPKRSDELLGHHPKSRYVVPGGTLAAIRIWPPARTHPEGWCSFHMHTHPTRRGACVSCVNEGRVI